MLKNIYTDIQLCIDMLAKMFNSITHYLKSLTNKSMSLNDSVKLFFTQCIKINFKLIINITHIYIG